MNLLPTDPKTKAVVHYIISHTDPARLGAIKLNKVMWRADVSLYRRYGRTVTGQKSYIRMPQGPVPNYVGDAVTELKDDGKIVERAVDTPSGVRREFVWIERAGVEGFAPEEIEALQEAIRFVCSRSARQASDETHDALWSEIENGKQMPIRAASVTPAPLDPSDIEWALSSESENI